MLRVLSRNRAGKKIFYGWYIVAAGMVANAYTSGVFFQGFSAFFNPIVKEFGWSHAVTSVAFSIQRTESGIAAPFVGFLIDRFGPRIVMMIGTIITGAGFLLLSRINSLWTFYLAFVVISLGLAMSTFIVGTTAVGNWFRVMRGRAMAVMSIGAGIGGIFVPLLVWLISVLGWRDTLVAAAIGAWVIGIPASMVMRRRPEDYGYLPDGREPGPEAQSESGEAAVTQEGEENGDGLTEEVNFTVREALRSPTFWQLSLAMSFGQMFLGAVMVHQIPALISYDIGERTAGLVVMFVALTSLVGRGGGGFLGDFVDKRYVLAVAFALQTAGALIFANISDTWHLVLYVIFFAPGFGASIPVRFALLADYFGRKSFGSLLGIMMTISVVFGVISPVFAGWVFDVTDSYRPAFLTLGGLAGVSVPLILMMKRPRCQIGQEAQV